jgi:hypothetical protein
MERGLPGELLYIPITVSMNPPDCDWAQAICAQLAKHEDPYVRGNAILGFGPLARVCGRLTLELVVPLVALGLTDADEYVRGQAHAAADDIYFFLQVVVPGFSPFTEEE